MTARILVVDDEPDLEALVMQKFRRQIRDGSEATVDRWNPRGLERGSLRDITSGSGNYRVGSVHDIRTMGFNVRYRSSLHHKRTCCFRPKSCRSAMRRISVVKAVLADFQKRTLPLMRLMPADYFSVCDRSTSAR